MATGLIIASTIAAAGAASAFAIMANRGSGKLKNEYSDFRVTQAEEGLIIPIVYGNCRLAGNIVEFHDLGTIKAKHTRYYKGSGGGGKGSGGGGSGGNARPHVFATLQVLCEGPATIGNPYLKEDLYWPFPQIKKPFRYIINDGTTSNFYYCQGMKHVASVEVYGWIGDEVPMIEWDVYSRPNTPLHSSVSTGINPACVAYDLIKRAGGVCDINSFQECANYYNAKNIGMNFIVKEQKELSEHLEDLYEWARIKFYKKNNVYFATVMIAPKNNPVYIDERDMKEFTFSRASYAKIPNDFIATFNQRSGLKDGVYSFTNRTLRVIKEGLKNITGVSIQKNYDWSCYNNPTTISRLLSEVIKHDTFPKAIIKTRLPIRYKDLNVGDLIAVQYEPIRLNYTNYIIVSITKNLLDGEIELEAMQDITSKPSMDIQEVNSEYTAPNYIVQDLTHVTIFQDEWTENRANFEMDSLHILPGKTKDNSAVVSYEIWISNNGTDYRFFNESDCFSYVGTLAENYPSNTNIIDFNHGILINFDESNIALDNLALSELFVTDRVIIINNEVMRFQTITEEGNNLRLNGILRGNHPKNHNKDSKIFIAFLEEALKISLYNKIYFKFLPKNKHNTLDLGDATPHLFIPNRMPEGITMIKATRNNNSINIEFFPNTNYYSGAGIGDPDIVTDTKHTFNFQGQINYTINDSQQQTTTETKITIQNNDAVKLDARIIINGFKSQIKTINIPIQNGVYFS